MLKKLTLFLACSIALVNANAQTAPNTKKVSRSKFILETLKLDEFDNDCGLGCSLEERPDPLKSYVVFASTANGDRMAIRISGKIYHLEGDGTGDGSVTEGKVGGRITRVWISKGLSVFLYGVFTHVAEEEEEGDSFKGTLKVTFHGHTQLYKIIGGNGC
jgi:hypothetical protein